MNQCPHCHAYWLTEWTECIYCQWPERSENRPMGTEPDDTKTMKCKTRNCHITFEASINSKKRYCDECGIARKRKSSMMANRKKRIWKKGRSKIIRGLARRGSASQGKGF